MTKEEFFQLQSVFCRKFCAFGIFLRNFVAIKTNKYSVAFTNFVQTGYASQLRIDARLMDNESRLFSDKMRLIFLQMPCFTKEADECENQFERWIYILKNMEILKRMPWAAQNAVFKRLAEVAEVSKLSKEDRLAYDHALKRYRDTYNTITGAEQKGRAEGHAEGLAEGE